MMTPVSIHVPASPVHPPGTRKATRGPGKQVGTLYPHILVPTWAQDLLEAANLHQLLLSDSQVTREPAG